MRMTVRLYIGALLPKGCLSQWPQSRCIRIHDVTIFYRDMELNLIISIKKMIRSSPNILTRKLKIIVFNNKLTCTENNLVIVIVHK